MGISLTHTDFRQARSRLPSGSSNCRSLLNYALFGRCLWLLRLSFKTTTANQSLRLFGASPPPIGRLNRWILRTTTLEILSQTPAPSLLPSTPPVQALSSQSNSRCLHARLQNRLVPSFGNHSTGRSMRYVLIGMMTSSTRRASK